MDCSGFLNRASYVAHCDVLCPTIHTLVDEITYIV